MERTGYGAGQLNDSPDDDLNTMDNQTPDDVAAQKAEIEQTRCEMAGTLDAIREKLDPGMLMEQAKEKVSETAATVMDKAKETVHEVTTDVVGQVKEVPHAAMDATKRAVGSAVDTAKEAMRPAVQTAGRVGGNVVDTVKSNPVPYAMIGIGLGWLFWSSRQGGSRAITRYEGVEGHYTGTGMGYGSTGTYGVQPQYRTEDDYQVDAYQGREPGPMSQMKDRVQGTLGAAAGSVKETAGNIADRAKDTAGNIADKAKDTAGMVAGRVQETAGTVATQVKRASGQAVDTFQSTLETNPLAVGAAVLGLGLALGLLLPETEKEKEMMGEARQRLGEKVQQKASELTDKVQTVARETVGAAKDAARDAAESEGLTGSAI